MTYSIITTTTPDDTTHHMIPFEGVARFQNLQPSLENPLEHLTCKVGMILHLPLKNEQGDPVTFVLGDVYAFGEMLTETLARWGVGRFDKVIGRRKYTTADFMAEWQDALKLAPCPDGVIISSMSYGLSGNCNPQGGQYTLRTPVGVSLPNIVNSAACHTPEDLPALLFTHIAQVDASTRRNIAACSTKQEIVTPDYALLSATHNGASGEGYDFVGGLVATAKVSYSDAGMMHFTVLDGQRIHIGDVKVNIADSEHHAFKIAFTLADDATQRGYIGTAQKVLTVTELEVSKPVKPAKTKVRMCATCEGKGTLEDPMQSVDMLDQIPPIECPACNGTGEAPKSGAERLKEDYDLLLSQEEFKHKRILKSLMNEHPHYAKDYGVVEWNYNTEGYTYNDIELRVTDEDVFMSDVLAHTFQSIASGRVGESTGVTYYLLSMASIKRYFPDDFKSSRTFAIYEDITEQEFFDGEFD